MWTLFGYSLSFGGNHAGIIGDFRWFGLNGVGMEAGPYADSIPHLVFCAFQMMFAMITPKDKEYPKSVHITTERPIIATHAIIVLQTFFLLTKPP